jgi:hypothetical protein
MAEHWIAKDVHGDDTIYLRDEDEDVTLSLTNNFANSKFGDNNRYYLQMDNGESMSLNDEQMLALIAWYRDFTAEDK